MGYQSRPHTRLGMRVTALADRLERNLSAYGWFLGCQERTQSSRMGGIPYCAGGFFGA